MADDFDEELESILNPKKRGLGRGLGALFEDEEGEYPSVEQSEEESFALRKTVGIDRLFPNPDQPRQYFDEKSINDLADSIREHGLLQPILVRPDKAVPNRYEIVAGERRWRACQKAQLHDVPIVIRDLDDDATLQIGLVENLQRRDLTPIEEARGYARLAEDFGHSHEEIGEAVSKSRSHVANMIRLLGLPDSVQIMLTKGDLSAGHARALLKAENPTILAQEIIANGLSVRDAEKMAAQSIGRSIQKRTHSSGDKGKDKDADLIALEKSLSDQLGMNFSIDMKDAKTGRVAIDFLSLDQLDDLLQRLSTSPKKSH
ncbi:MAG: ParB/RepB/Spo0J family partition protein [Alphaproteobacteria bacterium]|nr:ParB/RepB/Spo0J family partition protein [Alphaproteobacteria bacterium]NCQ88473.1 ParB/RepB/Spo0J family partition protein [Alphaproteobacteria bacterium]NCT06016.1 ParB/RepB/Spo0J family partition protein [Alphaproteobacteria bacterium]